MKKNRYQLYEEITPDIFLHYCTFSNKFLLLSKTKHILYEHASLTELKEKDPALYTKLYESDFILDDNINECQLVESAIHNMRYDTDLYNVVINTTLDCNLNCWYCYENKIAGSYISDKVINLVKNNIIHRYNTVKFSRLKVSFFGGEPFIAFDAMKNILEFSKSFCKKNKLELYVEFTTNATLITSEVINYLKEYNCQFQITIDGDKEKHNSVKYSKEKSFDAYSKVIQSLNMIDQTIHDHWIGIRINFDNRTLHNIDSILKDIKSLDRSKCEVILKRVWQVDFETIDSTLLSNSIQKIFDAGFTVDYYVVPRTGLCFAEREAEVLFNYDGKVFKCTTISNFNDNNKLGVADFNTGKITWIQDKISKHLNLAIPLKCKICEWFPACRGVCNKRQIEEKGEHLCGLKGLNLSRKEYLMYLLKYNLLKEKMYLNQYNTN